MEKMNEKELLIQEEEPEDHVYSFLKELIDSSPGTGGILGVLTGFILPQRVNKNRVDWLKTVAKGIFELQQSSGLQIESLNDNPNFILVLMQASKIAQRINQEERLTVLRNAVLNTAKGIDIDGKVQLMLINRIDEFTALHLKLLVYLHNPERWFKEREIDFKFSTGSILTGIELGIPDLKEEPELIIGLASDLFNKRLIDTKGAKFKTTMTKSEILAKRTSKLGECFLRYMGL
jgi:hypothetical protein